MLNNIKNTKPTVSIVMITYNHDKFIQEAVEGVLKQKCEYEMELIIANDCSPDNTDDVVEKVISSNRSKVRIIYIKHEKNLGIKPNFIFALSKAKGKYIAICEGDDYWIDSQKLQKQIDFLEENTDYVLIGNQAGKVYESEMYNTVHPPAKVSETDFDFDTKYLMIKNPISTLTCCFRNGLIKEFPEVYFKGTGGDRRLYLLLSQYGKCRYTNASNAVYRIHAGGVTNKYKGLHSKIIEGLRESIQNAENWNEYFHKKYNIEVDVVRHNCSVEIVKHTVKRKQFSEAAAFIKNIKSEKVNFKMKIIIFFLKIYKLFL